MKNDTLKGGMNMKKTLAIALAGAAVFGGCDRKPVEPKRENYSMAEAQIGGRGDNRYVVDVDSDGNADLIACSNQGSAPFVLYATSEARERFKNSKFIFSRTTRDMTPDMVTEANRVLRSNEDLLYLAAKEDYQSQTQETK